MVLHHLQVDAMGGSGICGGRAALALIDKGGLDCLSCDVLHRMGEMRDLGTILFRCGHHVQAKQMAQRASRTSEGLPRVADVPIRGDRPGAPVASTQLWIGATYGPPVSLLRSSLPITLPRL